jgi:hypothetical protein
VQVNPTNKTDFTTFTGDNTSGVYFWGLQLVRGSEAATYQKTDTAPIYSTPQNVSTSGARTLISAPIIVYDPNSTYNTSNCRFTPGVAGYYMFTLSIQRNRTAAADWFRAFISVNNSSSNEHFISCVENSTFGTLSTGYAVVYLGASDYAVPVIYAGSVDTEYSAVNYSAFLISK